MTPPRNEEPAAPDAQNDIEVHEKLALLELIQEATHTGTWAWDLRSGKVTWSQELERIYGYTDGSFPETYQGFASRVCPEDLPRLEANRNQAIATHQPFRTDFRICLPGGETRWLYSAGTAEYDSDGQAIRIIGVNIDITERKRGEEALQASEARYRGMVDDQTEVIARVRADGTFIYANEAFCRLYGKTLQELQDAPWQPTTHPYDVALVEERLRLLSPANPVVISENRVLARDGEVRWMQYANRGFYDADGRLLEIQAVGRDITERKRGEEALQASEARYRALIEDQTEAISRFLADGTLIFVNDVYCRLFGVASATVVGRKWQPVAYPDDLPEIEAALATLSPANPVAEIENRVFAAGGEVRWMQFVNRAFFDSTGNLTEIQSVGRDITERKAMEARKQALLEENTRLGRELIRLQEKERAALARELHDELSQQIAAIRIHGEVIRKQIDGNADALRANIEAIDTSAREIYTVTHRIMEGLHPQILDSAGLVEALRALLVAWSGKYPTIRAWFRVAPNLGPIPTEARIHLFRIAQECLTNVASHATANRVRLYLGPARGQGGPGLQLVVCDDGDGLGSGDESTGNGLIYMRERAHALGGRLDVRLARTGGLRVAVEIPVSGPGD